MLKRWMQVAAACSALAMAVPMMCAPLSASAEASLYDIMKERALAAWENYETSFSVSDLNISTEVAQDLYFDVMFTNSEYFYVQPRFQCNYYVATGYTANIAVTYSYDTAEIPAMREAFQTAVDQVFLGYDEDWSTVEKLLYFNDYLATEFHYNHDSTDETRRDAYNLLVEGSAVCQGYTNAMNVLCNRAGIPNGAVQSEDLAHIWNVVEVAGEWYHIDVTFADPTPNHLGRASHNFFLCSENLLRTDAQHDADDWAYYCVGDDPVCDSTVFDGAMWRDTYLPFVPYENNAWITGFPLGSTSSSFCLELCEATFTASYQLNKAPLYSHYDYWSAGSGTWYTMYYGAVDYYNGIIYFSDHNTIYRYSPDEGAVPFITLTVDEDATYDLFGFTISNTGLLRYQLGETPNTPFEDSIIYSVQLEDTIVTTTTTESTTTTTTTTIPETTTTATESTTTTTTTTIPETTTTATESITTTTTTTIPETTTTATESTTTTTTTTIPETTTTVTESTTTVATTIPETTTTATESTTTTTTTTIPETTTTVTESTTTTTTIPLEPTKPGDINDDGYLMINDVILLNRFLAEDSSVEISAQGIANADMNGDGAATATDSIAMLRILAGLKD